MLRIVGFILLSFLLINCTYRKNAKRMFFRVPVLIHKSAVKDTVKYRQPKFVNEVWYPFMGKYKFADTIRVGHFNFSDSSYVTDVHWRYLAEHDSLSSDGFQIFADYNTTFHFSERYSEGDYFPVYIVNETERTKLFVGKDSYVFGIQEAIDTSDYNLWHPIEGKGFDFCGNGYYGLKVQPGEFVLLLVPKYDGNEKQSMRVRIKIGDIIYLSNSYQGSFSRNQFEIKKEDWYEERLNKDKMRAVLNIFYGSVPKGYDEEDD